MVRLQAESEQRWWRGLAPHAAREACVGLCPKTLTSGNVLPDPRVQVIKSKALMV